jgi:hypothetical protein
MKMNSCTSASVSDSARSLVTRTLRESTIYNAAAVDAAPVIFDRDENVTARLCRRNTQRRFGRFTLRHALFGRFNAVVERVAYEVRQWLHHFIDHALIKFSFGA